MAVVTRDVERGALAAWINPRRVRRRLADWVQLPPGWRIATVGVARVAPARPDGANIEYVVTLRDARGDAGRGTLHRTRTVDPRCAPGVRLAIRRRAAVRLQGVAICLPAEGVLLHTPERDPELAALPELLDCEAIGVRLGADSAVRCTWLSYRAGRRATLGSRFHAGGTARYCVAKVSRDGLVERLPRLQRRVAAELRGRADAPRVPAVLDVWPECRTVIFEGLEPVATTARIDPVERAAAAGQALAGLHGLGSAGLARFHATDELRVLQRWLRVADSVDARLSQAAALCRWAHAHATARTIRPDCFLHRDFYDAQLLPCAAGWGVSDLDTAAAGERELDVGNYLAHCVWRGMVEGWPAPQAVEAIRLFVETYAKEAGARRSRNGVRAGGVLEARRLQFYVVTTLARLGVIHAMRTKTALLAQRLHERAGRVASDRAASIESVSLALSAAG
ncbi:MAG: hypothetical protein U1A27_12065 [Phycisphaerae bacterium]